LAIVAVASLLAACGRAATPAGGGIDVGGTGISVTTVSGQGSAPTATCTDRAAGGRAAVMVDWIDFVQLDGIQYVASLDGPTLEVPQEQLGPVVGRVQCQLSALTYAREPGPAKDGDAAFLAIGTEVHAVRGYQPRCRVAALINGTYRAYLAHQEVGGVSSPAPCATVRPEAP
jgi:hypothetical protein